MEKWGRKVKSKPKGRRRMIGNAGILEHTNMTSAKMIKAPGMLLICDTLAKFADSDNPSRTKSKAAEI